MNSPQVYGHALELELELELVFQLPVLTPFPSPE